MYTNTREILISARKNGYAVGAFNVENMEMVQAVALAAVQTGKPVIMQTTPSTVKYGGLEYFAANAKTAAALCDVPIILHLDHCEEFEMAKSAILCGYSSVMIDGSKLPLEDNIALTKRVVEFAADYGVPVEAELGMLAGKEDNISSGRQGCTDPDEAVYFTEQTGIDSLAVSIGTAHGLYKGEPNINIPLLEMIAAKLSLPLVLHGGSGLRDEVILDCICRGIAKVNYATELRIAFTDGVRSVLKGDNSIFDPKSYLKAGRQKVTELVKNRIELFSSANNYKIK